MRRIWMLCALMLSLTAWVSSAAAAPHSAKSHAPRWTRAVKHGHKAKRKTHHSANSQQTALRATAGASDPVLFGDQTAESGLDANTAGWAEAFPFTGATTGSAQSITIYVDSHSTAKTLIAGLYSDHNGHPGALLASGTKGSPGSGAWNLVTIPSTAVASGTKYWVALLGKAGALYFRDRSNGTCRSENSAQQSLSALPSTWKSGPTWNTCPVSAYVSGTASITPAQPVGSAQGSLTGVLAPSNTAPPVVSGTTTQGQTLTTTDGSWSNLPTSYAYAWQDCDSAGNSCTTISSATSSTYALTAADAGHTIRSVVTASNLLGSGTATSGPTETVLPLPPTNASPPAVTGTPTQGQTLSTGNGSWSNSPTSYTYVWQDCDTSGTNCTAISGGSSSSYTLASGDVGHTIRAVVSATNAGGSGSASSAPTPVVAAATPPPSAPANSALPVINGSTVQGQTLSTTNGTWTASPTSYTYAWQDCNSSGGSCTTISGASGSTYALSASDGGNTIRAVVTATNAGGSGSATSAPTAVVAAATPPSAPTNSALPAISGSTVQGQTLSTTNGTWTGSPTSYKYAWQDCDSSGGSCTAVSGASGSTYTLSAGDVGDTIRAVVTATNAGGSVPATSAPSAAITAPASGPCTESLSCWPNSSNTGYLNAPGYPGSLTTASASSSTCPLTFQSNHTYSFCKFNLTSTLSIGSSGAHLTNVHFVGDLFQMSQNTEMIHLYCDNNCTFDYDTMQPSATSTPNVQPHGVTFADAYGAIMYAGGGGYNTVGKGLQITHSNIWGWLTGIILGANTSATPILIQDSWLHDQGDCWDAPSCTTHDDGIGVVDTGTTSSYITINHNNMPFVHDNTNDIAFQSGHYDHLTITNNILSGDGYTVAVWGTSTNITFTGNVLTNYDQQEFGWLYPQDFYDTSGSTWAHNKFMWDPSGVSPFYEDGPGLGKARPVTAADSGKCWVPSGLSTTDYHGGVC